MQLWNGSLAEFAREATARTIAPTMGKAFADYHGYEPDQSEYSSWDHSLGALAKACRSISDKDIGMVVEYHLPFSHRRIDAVLLGRDSVAVPQAVVVELKQWDRVEVADPFELNVTVGDREHVHPSQQALDYAGSLSNIHSAFVDGSLRARSCSYLHNLAAQAVGPLLTPQFQRLLALSPLFRAGEEERLAAHLEAHVGRGHGVSVMEQYVAGHFRPGKKLLEIVDSTIRGDDQWHLIGRQREAYNHILADVQRLSAGTGHAAVLIRGGPGTGKSVIAVQLLADALRLRLRAAHSTGGKAFTTTLRSKFRGAGDVFIYNLETRKMPARSLDLLLVDEAHRVRKTSDTRFTPKAQQNKRSQMEELLTSSKVTVFFLDDNQFMRPDEIGCTEVVVTEAARLGIPVRCYDLDVQFRCGGCTEYTQWVDHTLGFATQRPPGWGHAYSCRVVETPDQLDELMATAKSAGERARIIAGFCWEWSDPMPNGSLVPDVQIGNWRRPWNRKRDDKKSYRPDNDPYTLWAETVAGEGEVGCIYSAQGFEFDRVGVIWGPDLVWRDGWVAQKGATFDRPVKSRNADTLRLVRNAYRVLLTRGMRETWVYCTDEATREHLRQTLPGA